VICNSNLSNSSPLSIQVVEIIVNRFARYDEHDGYGPDPQESRGRRFARSLSGSSSTSRPRSSSRVSLNFQEFERYYNERKEELARCYQFIVEHAENERVAALMEMRNDELGKLEKRKTELKIKGDDQGLGELDKEKARIIAETEKAIQDGGGTGSGTDGSGAGGVGAGSAQADGSAAASSYAERKAKADSKASKTKFKHKNTISATQMRRLLKKLGKNVSTVEMGAMIDRIKRDAPGEGLNFQQFAHICFFAPEVG
jgi:hypothetical protein